MTRYVVGNWKMNLLAGESVSLAQKVLESAKAHPAVQTWVAPSFLSIPAVSKALAGSTVKLGTQTVHGEAKGAFTGEISCAMLKEFDCSFALIAHSERRWVMGESDSVVSKKAAGALAQGITPVFCVGENLEERERNLTHEVLRVQLSALVEAISRDDAAKVIIAYEPCWAIGTGKVATLDTIADAHSTILKLYCEATGTAPRAILYGGSVTPDNFGEILTVPHVDGGLIGGASLKAESFAKLVELASKAG